MAEASKGGDSSLVKDDKTLRQRPVKAKSVNKDKLGEKALDVDKQNMQEDLSQQAVAETKTTETGGSQESKKPVPAIRRRKKKESPISRSTSVEDGDQFDNNLEGAEEDPAFKARGASTVENADETFENLITQTLGLESWKLDMLRLENIQDMTDMNVKISSKENGITVEGEETQVNKICNMILDLNEEIEHRDIIIPNDQNLIEFLKRPGFNKYISEVFSKKKINCHWELNKGRSVIDLYVFGKKRSKEAYEIIEKSFCQQTKSRADYVLLQHLCKCEQWQRRTDKIMKELDDKVIYIVSESGCDLTVVCTHDLEKIAVDRLEEMERALVKEMVLHLNDGKMLLLKIPIEITNAVTIKALPDQKCLIFDGEEKNVQKAMLQVKLTASKFKHAETKIRQEIPLTFLERAPVKRFINECLEKETLNAHWEVHKEYGVVDVYMINDEKLQFACDTIAKSFCKKEFDFTNNTDGFGLFCLRLEGIKEKNPEKIDASVDGNTIVIVCTSDLLAQITDLRKKCKVNILTTDFLIKELAVYDFMKNHAAYLQEIKENHSVTIEYCDKGCKVVIKGTKENLEVAKNSLKILVTQTFSKEVVPVSQERFLKFQNGDYDSVCKEFEDVQIHSSEVIFEDVKFDMQDNEIILTNKQHKPDAKTAVVVPKEDLEDSTVEVREEGAHYIVHCGCKNVKLEGGKDVQKLEEMFENILSAAEEKCLLSVLIPFDDLIGRAPRRKFTKLFLQTYSKFIQGKKRHVSGIIMQVCDRSIFQCVSGDVSEYLSSLLGIDTASARAKKIPTVRIIIEEGKLASKKADVIVNSVGSDLNLSLGAVSQSLLGAAGKGLQLEIKSKCPEGLAAWQMVVTDGHNLCCSKVYHVVLDGYRNENTKASKECLRAFEGLICDCLCEMDKSAFRSIAFPVLGTGNLGYQAKDVADVMMTAVEDYSRTHPSTSIKEVIIVVFAQPGRRNKKVFDKRLERYPKRTHVEETEVAREESDQYELVIVGLKDDVAKAKTNLVKKFKEDEKEESKEAKKAKKSTKAVISSSDVHTDKGQTPDSSNIELTKTIKTLKPQSRQHSGDISDLDKLLDDVRVELKENFICKLPDMSILERLGWFKVKKLTEENKYWLKGTLTDLENVGAFLKTVVRFPGDHYTFRDVSREVYDLVCCKFERFQDRISYDTDTNKVTILKADKEIGDCIDKYIQYQFDEVLPKQDSRNGSRANAVENDRQSAHSLKLEKRDKFQTVEYFISSKDRVLKIAAPTHDILSTFKFALEVKTGRKQVRERHGRTDATIEPPKRATSKVEQQPETQHTFSTSRKEIFKTREGIEVYVYKYDILKLEVDCIVNAANRKMKHGGGVALSIARAAGYALEQESRDYIKRNGKLDVGSCCTTSAGNLHYKRVIHTVGPAIQYYKEWEHFRMRADLRKAVRVCFDEAEKLGLLSIGMTSISSGVYGVPKDWCAEEYAVAVHEYSKDCGRITTLKEIHFVDVNDEMLAAMNKRFQITFNKSRQTNDNINDRTTDSSLKGNTVKRDRYETSETAQSKEQYPKPYKEDSRWYFEMNKNLKVVVYTDDITKFKTGAISCSQDTLLRSAGGVAGAIKRSAGQDLELSLRKHKSKKLKVGEVVVTGPGCLNCAAIYHVVSPDFFTQKGQKVSDSFLLEVHMGYLKCLQTAHKQGVLRVAIPLFGCGMLSGSIDKLAKTFQTAVVSFCSDPALKKTALREVHAINDRDGVTHMIKTAFFYYIENNLKTNKTEDLYGDGNFELNNLPSDSQRSKDSFSSKTSTSNPERTKEKDNENEFPDADISADETCPICIDKFVNPKTLTKCGHVFCAECIDAQFKVTPKCPNCSTVYGIITGDQPEGKMTFYTDSRTRLSGYEQYNTIVITYAFPAGVQGPDHPQPGTRYKGISRNGYLPNNNEGHLIFEMLKLAFDRKLVFTIGSSRTTGHEGVITWNDIHHKTDPRPHSTFGYPDPSYLGRVKDELAAKGVTPDDIPQLSHR